MQGGWPLNPVFRDECLARNIEAGIPYRDAKRAVSQLDLPKNFLDWERDRRDSETATWIVHLGEGQQPPIGQARFEFDNLKKSGMLGSNLIAIHGVALTREHMKELAAAGAKLVWSPLSNLILYGKTAEVAAAKEAGVLISLAPDWAPSGSKSLLGELKVADIYNRSLPKPLFDDREIVAMATRNPARALGWSQYLGTLGKDKLGDVVVVNRVDDDPYRNLILATEDDISLVLVRGEPLYGNTQVLAALRKDEFEPMPARVDKAVVLKCAAYWGGNQPVGTIVAVLRARMAAQPWAIELSPLYTRGDRTFFDRLRSSANLPAQYKRIEDYYR